jgi:hypothetical protein
MYTFTTDDEFETYLEDALANPEEGIVKLPYIKNDPNFIRNRDSFVANKDITIRYDNKSREKLLQIYQKGVDIKKNGRLKGNMQYVEDS